MTTDYSKVSLGFAEFLSQLIHETFDAILDAQNYQADKYLGLEKALSIAADDFRNKYLSEDEVNEYFIGVLGFRPEINMLLSDSQISAINSLLVKNDVKEIVKNKLTAQQYQLVTGYLLESLVSERKMKIRMFVERPELARIFVDSGEIKAKLNLSFLNEDVKASAHTRQTDSRRVMDIESKSQASVVTEGKSFQIREIDFGKINLPGKFSNISIKEILDKETGVKTILINKDSLKEREADFNIPTTRIIANPVTGTSSAISSEVTIKFRTI